MQIFDVLTIICIGVGAAIMMLAALKTVSLRKILASGNDTRWRWLSHFMIIFFVGYLVSITLIVLGYNEPLLLLIGLVFLLGACFVYMVVSSAKSDIIKINDSNAKLSLKNEELKKSNLELDQFAYRTSHDLKAPITSLKGLIHIATHSESKEETERIHEMMAERLGSLENLIRDILDLSKNSRTDLQLTKINVRNVIQELIRNYTAGSRDTDVSVTVAGEENLDVTIDSTRFKMIVGNLIGNGKQYADLKKDSPFVKIEYWKENGSLYVSVKDNGKGIAKTYQKKVFEMFYRVEETSQGSGLGLYIVKETLDKMGGSIDLVSQRGEGSEFIISIPLSN